MGQAETTSTTPEPADIVSWLRSDVPDDEKTTDELCREWRLVDARMKYDIARLPPQSPSESDSLDAIVDVGCERQHEIELALVGRELETVDDLQGVLGIALRSLREGGTYDDRDIEMLKAVHSGLNHVRNAMERKVAS